MRITSAPAAMLLVLAHVGVYSCDYHDDWDHHDHDFEDVTVDVTGTFGTDFEARFEDDDHAHTVTAEVPFAADFRDQEGYFQAVVEKDSAGTEQLCVKVTVDHDSRQDCTSAPHGQASVTIVF